jgi:very-short-patch-repair endonuclease
MLKIGANERVRKMAKRKTNEEFLKEITPLLGEEYLVLSDYVNLKTKVKFKHVICGNDFDMLPGNFIYHGQRCPVCGQIKSKIAQTRTQDEFVKIINDLVNDEYTVLGTYVNSETKINIRHNLCGHEYEVKPGNFINNNRRCPICSELRRRQKRTYPVEQFKKEMAELVGDEYEIVGEYTKRAVPLEIKHNKCGNIFKCSPLNFIYGQRCIYCGKMYYKSQEYFENEVSQLENGEYTVLGKYKNTETKILMRHNKCGNKYMVKPANFLSGKRCPICKESNGEKIITKYLKKNNITYKPQFSFSDLIYKKRLRFDFAIFANDKLVCLIEFDGPQHFNEVSIFGGAKSLKEQKTRDEIKTRYCNKKGHKLLRISYTQINEIPSILDKELLHK